MSRISNWLAEAKELRCPLETFPLLDAVTLAPIRVFHPVSGSEIGVAGHLTAETGVYG